MKLSIHDLVVYFIDKSFNVIKQRDMERILIKLTEVLQNGTTDDDIIQGINRFTERITRRDSYDSAMVVQICNRIYSEIRCSGNNLIKPDGFYYHNELRLFPGPVQSEYDWTTCTYVFKDNPYFLKKVSSYTIEDFIEYLKTKEAFRKLSFNDNGFKGQVKYMFERYYYNVDFLLFLVDTINDIYIDKKKYVRNMFELNDYVEEATDNYNGKKTSCSENNVNEIVYKKRVMNCKII